MFILNPEQDQDKNQEVLNNIRSLIEKFGGEVGKIEDWGARRLAYEINKLKEGHYYLLNFKCGTKVVPELEHFFRVTDGVMRYLVIREKN